MFMDKPIAANFAEVLALYTFADALQVPVFSSSSLRWLPGIRSAKLASAQPARQQREDESADTTRIVGANVTSPCPFETQFRPKPDFYFCECRSDRHAYEQHIANIDVLESAPFACLLTQL